MNNCNSKPNAVTRAHFHSDHLGSTSYLTDNDGNVSQFVCYTPYGETLVDEHLTDIDSILHNGTYRTKYLFNGKELDNETHLYYYGARYFEPNIALWYGVDPLTEKYPFNSAYVYCNANPVKYVDPDGEATYSYEDEDGNVQYQWFESDKMYYADEKGNLWKYYSADPPDPQDKNTSETHSYDQNYGEQVWGDANKQSLEPYSAKHEGPGINQEGLGTKDFSPIERFLDWWNSKFSSNEKSSQQSQGPGNKQNIKTSNEPEYYYKTRTDRKITAKEWKTEQWGKNSSTTVTKWDTVYITTRQTYRKSDSKIINTDTLYIGNSKP